MRVTLNGTTRDIDGAPTVAELVECHAGTTKGIAVAVNAEVVPRSTWSEHRLADGDHIEVLHAAQGG